MTFRIASGDPSVTSPRTSHSGCAHNASYATTDPSECATTISVSGPTAAQNRRWISSRSPGSVKYERTCLSHKISSRSVVPARNRDPASAASAA